MAISSTATSVAATAQTQKLSLIIDFFRKKGAVQTSKAIRLSNEDWSELSNFSLSKDNINELSFLVQTDSNKYYLDETLLKKSFSNQGRLAIVVGVISLLAALVIAYIYS